MEKFIVLNETLLKNNFFDSLPSEEELLAIKSAVEKSLRLYLDPDVAHDFNSGIRGNSLYHAAFSEYAKATGCFVYIMKDQRSGYYKIGSSNNPQYREKTLQSECPMIDLVFAIPAPRKVEKELHDKYSLLRVRGEWFSLHEADVLDIHFALTSYSVEERRRIECQIKSSPHRFNLSFNENWALKSIKAVEHALLEYIK